MNKNIENNKSIGFGFLKSYVWPYRNYIHMYVCNCKTEFFKNRYFILKKMSLNVKIITQSAKSPDPLILETSGKI